ncbi:hypothetical protein M426DRAFT_316049 [Hypoxylon sp. CI-4A]|nr:hypothetical protein M426DRAFT_316049 [Hypoxylon sp. CI-4A]
MMSRIRDLLVPMDQDNPIKPEEIKEEEASGTKISRETTHFTLEFIVDIICPYCYIGLKNLDAAIEAYRASHPEATFEITCSPFLLDPLALRSAYDKAANHILPARSLEDWAGLGEPVGINFAWKGRSGSTRDAHKLLRLALESTPTTVPSPALVAQRRSSRGSAPQSPAMPPGSASPHAGVSMSSAPESSDLQPNPSPTTSSITAADNDDDDSFPRPQNLRPHGPSVQMSLLRALLRAHHETDADISDPSVLTQLAASAADLGPEPVTTVLESRGWARVVDALYADLAPGGRRRGLDVRAVPTLVVNDRYVIGGAQDARFLVGAFDRIRTGVRKRGRERDGEGKWERGQGGGDGDGDGDGGRERTVEEWGSKGG